MSEKGTTQVAREGKLDRLDWNAIRASPDRKREYVTRMFGIVASSYDTFTRWFSLGMDGSWKRELFSYMPKCQMLPAADLACGTGDILGGLMSCGSGVPVVGVDVAMEMAILSRRKHSSPTVVADVTRLPFRDDSLATVTIGYGLRNASSPVDAVRETRRVLMQGGVLLVLDFYRPAVALWRYCFVRYLTVVGSIFGIVLHKNAAVYRYLGESVSQYLSILQFEQVLAEHQFCIVRRRRHLFGGICIHVAQRI